MKLVNACKTLIKDAASASFDLYKVMIPVIIIVKLLQELDLIQYLAVPLKPIMGIAGLPAEMGLVWATSMIVNLYSGLIVYISMVPTMAPLSVAQITTLATMMLIAHSLPVECKVAQKCGISMMGQLIVRILSAFFVGFFMHLVFSKTGIFAEPSKILLEPQLPESGLIPWALNEANNLAYIFVIILALFALMRLLTYYGITEKLNELLRPILQAIGIGKDAATLTVLGLSLGITYGSGLIIHEIKSGSLSKRDVFASLTLMGLAHALIEDTLLMMLIGAHISGTLWTRLLFAIIFVGVMMRFYSNEPAIAVNDLD
ncbi:nucleoside recognition domain-containing protein [Halodesulfovibrio aestuarii]|uniref:nucleoside recognition domain-containing protein n=1 Tax=Halodesulfovibrio aestuarii TaxID=126333 RepID=UPI00041570CB